MRKRKRLHRDHLIQWHRLEHQGIRVRAQQQRPQRLRTEIGAGTAAHEQRLGVRTGVGRRQVQMRGVLAFVYQAADDVPGYSDDGDDLRVRCVVAYRPHHLDRLSDPRGISLDLDPQGLPHRIFARPQRLRSCRADDHHARILARFLRPEIAAVHDRYRQHREILGRNEHVRRAENGLAVPHDGRPGQLSEQRVAAGHHDLLDVRVGRQRRNRARRQRLVVAALIHRDHAARIQPQVGRADGTAVSDECGCHDEQRQRDGDLAADEKTAEGRVSDRSADLPAQRVGERQPRGLECREQGEHERRARRDGKGEQEHANVELERGNTDERRYRGRQQAQEQDQPRANCQAREQQACACREHGDEEPLGQQLADDAAAACAERQPHTDFTLACGRPREHDVGRVRAGGHQHQREGGEDGRQDRQQLDTESHGSRLHAELGTSRVEPSFQP